LPAERLQTAEDKIKDLEQRLCQAQSLIHRLLSQVDRLRDGIVNMGGSCTGDPVSDIRPLAEKLVAELAMHKRVEHAKDVKVLRDAVQRKQTHITSLSEARRWWQMAHIRAEEVERQQRYQLAELEAQLAAAENATDKDLLG
jgi:hypothetical protein